MPDNIVLIGVKPVMSYTMSVMMLAKTEKEIILKARGRSIQRCVDVSQIAINKYLESFEISNVKIATEEIEARDEKDKGKKFNVSTIEITLSKVK